MLHTTGTLSMMQAVATPSYELRLSYMVLNLVGKHVTTAPSWTPETLSSWNILNFTPSAMWIITLNFNSNWHKEELMIMFVPTVYSVLQKLSFQKRVTSKCQSKAGRTRIDDLHDVRRVTYPHGELTLTKVWQFQRQSSMSYIFIHFLVDT